MTGKTRTTPFDGQIFQRSSPIDSRTYCTALDF